MDIEILSYIIILLYTFKHSKF